MEDLSSAKLDQIREILLGDQLRATQHRLDALEAQIAEKVERLERQIQEVDHSISQRCEELRQLQERMQREGLSREAASELLSEIAMKLEQGNDLG